MLAGGALHTRLMLKVVTIRLTTDAIQETITISLISNILTTVISRRLGLVVFVIGFIMLWLQGIFATFIIIPYLTLFMPPEVVGNTPLSVTHILSIAVLIAGTVIFFVARSRDIKK
jgi:hypothetical protein